jgi:hypothetical protein
MRAAAFAFELGDRVLIEIGRDGGGAVAEAVAHDPGGDAGGKGERCVGVP